MSTENSRNTNDRRGSWSISLIIAVIERNGTPSMNDKIRKFTRCNN